MNHLALAVPEMSQRAAAAIVALLHRRAGITIQAERTDLLRNRLGRRLRDLGLADFDGYVDLLASPHGSDEIVRMVEALTTHTTSFFREGRQYQWLAREGLPEIVARGHGDAHELVVWSAACSTGAEIWSAAMVLEEFGRQRFRPLSYRGVATDISRPILAKAKAAVYAETEIAGVPEELRRAYLLRSRDQVGADGRPIYRIAPELRARVVFSQANLVELDKAPRILADVVFLRNVLIYFERADQDRIVRDVAARVRLGGYLLTGHAEALPEAPRGLSAIMSSVYRKEA